MKIVEVAPSDAERLLDLQRRLDRQSEFMLLEPDERVHTPESLAAELSAREKSYDFIAIADDGRAVGWTGVRIPKYRRIGHKGELVLGVDADVSGQGIGSALVDKALERARELGLKRIELTVMAGNHRAKALYERKGFVVEGVAKASLLRSGEYVDEIDMGLVFEG